MNIMIIVPHPDDEILGFGGTIQRHINNGDKVLVYYISDHNRNKRKKQQVKEVNIVKKLLGFDTKIKNIKLVEKNFLKCVNYIESEIKLFKPDVLYSVFYGDNHQDHEYLFKVLKISTRIWSDFLVKKIYLGEIPSSTDQSPKLSQFAFIPTTYTRLSKQEINKKIECMKCYTEEIKSWPHPRSEKGILNLAERRGSECKSDYAESFVVLRDIN